MAISASACLADGSCFVITKSMWYVTIGVYSLAGILLILMFFVAFTTPAFTFLSAKLTKKYIVPIVNRSQTIRFAIGKMSSEGVIDVKKSGPFLVTENSHVIEHKSKLPLFFAFGEFAATMPLKWVYVNNKIKDIYARNGIEIKNSEDLGNILGKEFDMEFKQWVKKGTIKKRQDDREKVLTQAKVVHNG